MGRSVQSHNQRRQFVFLDVLQFVHKKRDACSVRLRGGPYGFKEGSQVGVEVSVVRKPRLRVEIKADLDVVVFEFEGFRKPCESRQGALRQLLRGFPAQKFDQGAPQFRRQNGGEGSGLRRLDANRQ